MTATETAERYFKLSNEGDLESVSNMFVENSVYISESTGTYLGRKNIMDMMEPFFNSFETLKWTVNSLKEMESGVIEIHFTFFGRKKDGENIERSGIETLTIEEGMIKQVEIKSKS